MSMTDEEQRRFDRMKRNSVVCIQHLVKLAQDIEKYWHGADIYTVDAAPQAPPAVVTASGDSADVKTPLSKTKEADVEVSAEATCHRLSVLQQCLFQLTTHSNEDCRHLSGLAPKLKNKKLPLVHFQSLFLPIERAYTKGLRDDEFLVTEKDSVPISSLSVASTSSSSSSPQTASDSLSSSKKQIPLIIVMDNMRSAFNVGSVFRTAECLSVEHLYLCGFTSVPEEEDGNAAGGDTRRGNDVPSTKKQKKDATCRLKGLKTKQVSRTTMDTHKHVSWTYHRSTTTLLAQLKAKKCQIVAMETAERSASLHDFVFEWSPSPEPGEFSSSYAPVVLVLGNERYGLEPALLRLCDHIVSIPCLGMKNSLNVGVAMGIAGYEVLRQWRIWISARSNSG